MGVTLISALFPVVIAMPDWTPEAARSFGAMCWKFSTELKALSSV